jgi:hypothetical protein
MNIQPSYREEQTPDMTRSERPTSSIVSDLWNHTELLLHQELDLVRADLDIKATRIKRDVTAASLSGAVIYAGVLTLLAGVVALLSKWMEVWLSAMLVGAVVLIAGYAVNRKSTRDLEAVDVVPRETGRSLKRTAQTVKEAVQ